MFTKLRFSSRSTASNHVTDAVFKPRADCFVPLALRKRSLELFKFFLLVKLLLQLGERFLSTVFNRIDVEGTLGGEDGGLFEPLRWVVLHVGDVRVEQGGEGEDDRVTLDERYLVLRQRRDRGSGDRGSHRRRETLLEFQFSLRRKCFSPFAGKESKETVSCRLANFHPRVFQ